MRRIRILREPHEIADAIRAGTLRMAVYHRGHRARLRRLCEGFQPTPWCCPRCRRLVKFPDDLRYEWCLLRKMARGKGSEDGDG